MKRSLNKSNLVFSDYDVAALGNLIDVNKKHAREIVTFEEDTDTCDNFMAKLKRNTYEVGKRQTVKCSQEELVFDNIIVDSPFATYYGFTCSNFYLRGIFNSLIMVGMLLGSFIIGVVSDYLGRKRTLQVVNLLLVAAGVDLVIVFAICRVIIRSCSIGTYISAVVCLLENTVDR